MTEWEVVIASLQASSTGSSQEKLPSSVLTMVLRMEH